MSSINHQIDIDEILTCIRNAIIQAHTEEDVRVRVSNCIEEKILRPLGIAQVGKYEYILISGARVDALYGHVIIEYKAPGKLSRDSDIQKAKEQVIRYIMSEAGSKELWDRYLGVIISDRIAFVRYDRSGGAWILRGPYEVRREVIIKLIEALRGLKRKSLSVNNIVADFGPDSPIAKRTIKLIYTKLLTAKSKRTGILFADWMRLFKQATGYDPNKLKELKELVEEYGLSGSNVNYDALIFSVHTYYALIMKLLAAEVAYLYGSGRFYRSYVAELDDEYVKHGVEGVATVLKELEDGGIFKRLLNIENFLEGDYFSWYLEEIDRDLADAVAEIARRLSDYEIATPQLEPESARDLLKRLYQNLMPRDIRHSLGEYYTPDWLAELMLDEVGLSLENLNKMGENDPLKPLKVKILDPACGSGTFLVLYISRLRRYAEEHFLVDALPNYVLENVVGYDLNPLAVLSARTNYLLAVADLLTYVRGTVEIPIYLADSIMIEERYELKGGKDVYVLRTVAGEFRIPKDIAKNANLLRKVLDEVRTCLENMCSPSDFSQRLKLYNLDHTDVEILLDLYNKLLDLERQGKDKVWVSILRNAFAPILKGKFDIVVGNPPWVNWENLPEQYREVSKSLWENYGLAEITGKTGLGKVKKDLAMLFLARSFDRYLKEGGKLGFLITFTVFKTQAGAGFRSFLARNTKMHIIHDLVTLMPFEGATNRTGAVVVEKICDLDRIRGNTCSAIVEVRKSNMSGVRNIVWVGKQIDPDTPLEEVLKTVRRYEIVMIPLMHNDLASPWMQVTPNIANVARKVIGESGYYEAHAGVYTGLNQVYYVKVLERTSDGMLIITNPPESGQKKKVKQVEAKVEPDLVYPLIRGEDVKKWYVEFKDRYIILPSDSKGNSLSPTTMRIKYPNAYIYFYQFFNELISRGGEPYKSKLKPYKNLPLERAEKLAPPFYWVFNASTSLAPYKVVWKEVSARMTIGGFHVAVIEPLQDKYLGEKTVIPDHTVVLIPAGNKDEAYYLAGILNSMLITFALQYAVVESISNLKILKFDPNNELHRRIAELSRRAHELARCVYASSKPSYCAGVNAGDELRKVEDELDLAVARLYGVPEGELKEFRRLMAILSGEEVLVEDVVEVPNDRLLMF